MNLRRLLGRCRAQACEWIGVNARARRRLDGSHAAILYYHRVLPHDVATRDCVEPGMYVTPESFARQLDWLGEHFRVMPLHEIVSRFRESKSLPDGACAVTFDDGWRDNFDFALPELVARQMTATLFVVTERVATPGAFWPDEVSRRWWAADETVRREVCRAIGLNGPVAFERALDHLKGLSEVDRVARIERLRALTPEPPTSDPRELLDWDEIERLAAAGVSIESHGATHAILTGLPEADVVDELRRSREQLRARGHGQHDLFAYPSGGWNARIARLAREQGYHAAFSTDRGLAHSGGDPLCVPRLGLHDDISSTRAEFLYRIPGAL